MSHRITLIPGDGIGKEVVSEAVRVIEAAGVKIEWVQCDVGLLALEKGHSEDFPRKIRDSVASTKILLKGPLETPIGYGATSVNVLIRKEFLTYANVRPIKTIEGIEGRFSEIPVDMVVIRENIEDLYAGVEYRSTANLSKAFKVISVEGCERIVRFAFNYAVYNHRRKVTCVTKANILKLTEGCLKRIFERIALDYPIIEIDFLLVDNCAHQMVVAPENLDVLVMTNMNGDILSDLASGLVGGLGVAPSMNIGPDVAIFEAVHGSAPEIAGLNRANPTALILSSLMMLDYIGEREASCLIRKALSTVLKRGFGTPDTKKPHIVSTTEFGDLVIEEIKSADRKCLRQPSVLPCLTRAPKERTTEQLLRKKCVGFDLYVDYPLYLEQESGLMAEKNLENEDGWPHNERAFFLKVMAHMEAQISKISEGFNFRLENIINDGIVVFPTLPIFLGSLNMLCLRFMSCSSQTSSYKAKSIHRPEVNESALSAFLGNVSLPWVSVEKLFLYDEIVGFSIPHGASR